MQNYLVVYYNGVKPTFTYTETLDAARSYALIVLSSQHYDKRDVISIVEVASERVLYFGKGAKLANKLNAVGKPVITTWPEWFHFFKSVINRVGLKLAKQAV